MATVYFLTNFGDRRLVGGGDNPLRVIREDLAKSDIEPMYFRYWKNEEEWTVDFGNWSCFYKVTDWDGNVDENEATDSAPDESEATDSAPDENETPRKKQEVFDPVEEIKFKTDGGDNLVVSSGWRMADNSTPDNPIFISEAIGGYFDTPAYRLMYDFGGENVTIFRDNTEFVTMDAVEFDEFFYKTTHLMNNLSSLINDKYERDFDDDSFRVVIKHKEKKND